MKPVEAIIFSEHIWKKPEFLKNLLATKFRTWVLVFAISLGYFLLGRLGTLLAMPPGYSTAVFPASGLALFAVLRYGPTIWPGILIGSFSLNAWITFTNQNFSFINYIPTGLGIGAGACFEALAGAYLLKKMTGSQDPFASVKNILVFIVFSSFVGSLFSASCGIGTLYLSELLTKDIILETWVTWWLGDSIGIMVITPILLVISRPNPYKITPPLIIESFFLVALTIAISKYTFEGLPRPMGFLTFPLLVWAALRFEVTGATISVFIVSIISIWETINGQGPFGGNSTTNESLILVQTFIGVGAPMALILAVNLLEKRKITESLKSSEERLARTEEFSLVMVTHVDLNGKWIKIPQTLCDLLGYTREELLNDKFKSVTHPDDFISDWSQCQQIIQGKIKSFDMEKRYIRKNGEIVWVYLNCSIVEDPDGKPHHFLSYIRDISERKKLEEKISLYSKDLEKRIKERTLELQKSNESLQDFASIASHDLQEPLRKIAVFGDRLKTKLTNAGKEEIDSINRMQRATLRMQSLINDLLEYSKISSPVSNPRITDLNNIVKEVLLDLDASIQSTQGEIHIGPLPKLEVDPTQMQQLFQNLISNAIKYHKTGIAPKIRIESNKLDNKNWEISVSDNGIGFEDKYSKKIYKPFERLHGITVYQGTGMGLAICQKIVSNHGGEILTQSKLGKGSTFTVLLPQQKL
ncbi:MAG: PAS domain S-box protein [Alphaproteobacteria bacterium]|jgi:PAS domain S-box-containing protein|nr:PAS domain S-box protein [Alphaproteobacteria bacterium]